MIEISVTGGCGNGNARGKNLVGIAIVKNDDFGKSLSYRNWCLDSDGYPISVIKINGKNHNKQLHKFVYEYYYGELPKKPLTIDHIDRNKFNNIPENLRAVSQTIQRANTIVSDMKGIRKVVRNKINNYWRVTICRDKRVVFSKYFPYTDKGLQDAKEAHKKAYNMFYPEIIF